jgi:hypothetical protein
MDDLTELLRLAEETTTSAPPQLADDLWSKVAATYEQASRAGDGDTIAVLMPAAQRRPQHRIRVLAAAAVALLLGIGAMALWQPSFDSSDVNIEVADDPNATTVSLRPDTTCADTRNVLALDKIPTEQFAELARNLDRLALDADTDLATTLGRSASTLRQAAAEVESGQTLQSSQTLLIALRPVLDLTAQDAGELWDCLGG